MDKKTISNFGWIIICVLVLLVIIALATPFSSYIGNFAENILIGFNENQQSKIDNEYENFDEWSVDTTTDNLMQDEFNSAFTGTVIDNKTGKKITSWKDICFSNNFMFYTEDGEYNEYKTVYLKGEIDNVISYADLRQLEVNPKEKDLWICALKDSTNNDCGFITIINRFDKIYVYML